MKIKKEEILTQAMEMIKEAVKTRPTVPIPKLKLPKADEELMCLFVSDCQIGLKTPTYNMAVFEERVGNLIKNYKTILRKERRTIPIKKMALILGGDILHNDVVGRFLTLEEFEAIVVEQLFQKAIPCFEMFLAELLKDFESVEIYACAGNHGGYSQLSVNDNYDLIFYKILELIFRNEKRLKWNIAKNFYIRFDLMGYKFNLMHGDQVGIYSGIPYFALIRKTLNLNNALGGFDYQLVGHFHHSAYIAISAMAVMINGTFVSDDEYSLKRLGVCSPPRQWIFGMHPKYGMTFRYELHLEKGG